MACAVSLTALILVLSATTLAQSRVWPPILLPDSSDPVAPAATAIVLPGNGMTVNAIAVDASENIYVAGSGRAADVPALDRGFDATPDGVDAFVAKLDRNGAIVWATYLGGTDRIVSAGRGSITLSDSARAIAVDASGQVYVAGTTGAANFPVTASFQSSRLGETDGFVAKLSSDGRRLLYASYIGATGESMSAGGIAVGAAGDVWIDVQSPAQRFTTTRDLGGGTGRRVILKLSPSGSPVWSTRLPLTTEGGFAVDGAGRAYSAGGSCRTTGECRQELSRLDPSGTTFQYTVSFQNAYADVYRSQLALLPNGRAVFSGVARDQLPAGGAAPCPNVLDCGRAFVAVAGDNGSIETTFFGVSETPLALAADLQGRVSVAVATVSASLALVRPVVDHHVDGPVYISRDRGTTYHVEGRSTLPDGAVKDLAFNPRRNSVYAVTNRLYESQDEAKAWRLDTNCNLGIAECYRVAVDPVQSTVRYGIFGDDVFRHDDGGSGWRQVYGSRRGTYQRTVVISPHDRSVWIAGNAGVAFSPDGGASWIDRNAGLPNLSGSSATVETLAFDPERPGVVYAMTQVGVYRLAAGGQSWEHLTAGLSPAPYARAIAFDKTSADTMHVATLNYGMLKSTDGGRTWTRSLEGNSLTVVQTDHMKRHIVYAGGNDAQGRPVLYRSIDRGATWHRAGDGWHARSAPADLIVDTRDSMTLYVGSSSHQAVPYIVRLQPNGATPLTLTPEFASYFGHGTVTAMTTTVSGGLVVALNHSQQIATVRLAP